MQKNNVDWTDYYRVLYCVYAPVVHDVNLAYKDYYLCTKSRSQHQP